MHQSTVPSQFDSTVPNVLQFCLGSLTHLNHRNSTENQTTHITTPLDSAVFNPTLTCLTAKLISLTVKLFISTQLFYTSTESIQLNSTQVYHTITTQLHSGRRTYSAIFNPTLSNSTTSFHLDSTLLCSQITILLNYSELHATILHLH